MEKSKSILLLKSFSKQELKRFGDFLLSPYFNSNTRVSRLFEELKKHQPAYSGRGVEKESLYKKLFPGKVYNEQVMKNLISEMLRLEKEFLAIDNYNGDKINKSLALISQLASRPVDSLYNKEMESFEKEARESQSVAVLLHYDLFRLEEIKFRHNIIINRQAHVTENIVKAGEYLIIFFLKNILRLSVNININKFSFNTQTDINLTDKLLQSLDIKSIMEYMEYSGIEHSVNIRLLYYAMICNLKIDDDAAYKTYRELLYANLAGLKRDEANILLHFLESIIAQKINSGRHEFYGDLFETYKVELAENLYSPDESSPLTVMKFRNIYLTAIRAGDYRWAEKFISNYKKELHEENRKNIVELALAQLNFEKGEFGKTLQHLNKIKTDQVFFKVDVKVLSLMAFYELGHYESAISLIESFKRMLNSNPSLTEQYSQKNIAFANSTGSLIKLKSGAEENEVNLFMEKTRETEVIGNKSWLLNKAKELKKVKGLQN